MRFMNAGRQLGHYEILEAIGKGGMGEVWRARDLRLGREVAIKTLPAEFSQDREHLARFRREAQSASALNHPNICIVYDLGEEDHQPFIVMELLRGETMREKLARGPIPVEEVLDVGSQLASALDAAHSQGIVHRDLKPANIFVTETGLAKILDFGLARVQNAVSADAPTLEDVTGAGSVLGTVSYMSPEQARGEDLDGRSDLFSLGVVLYEMATGKPAFSGDTSAVIFDRIFNQTPEPTTRHNAAVPRELDSLITRLLAKRREERLSSARELRSGLDRLKQDPDSGRTTREVGGDKKSIAVLPFENHSADADNEFFSDGLTDEIISDLSQIRSLRVISRNSSMQFKGSDKDQRTVAQELNVRYLLEGRVRKAGNAVRVTAQLVDPLKDEHLWAGKYSGQLEDIFDIQEQISRQIVDALKMQLSPEEDKKLGERAIDNVEALECYQRARYEIYKFTAEGLDRALELIDTALGIVGENELLLASKGTVYWQYVNAAIRVDDGYIDKAEDCARRVFALNPDSAAGHALLGSVRHSQGRHAESIRCYERALELDPNEFYALGEMGRVYLYAGFERLSGEFVQKAIEVDPMSPIHHAARQAGALWFGYGDITRGVIPSMLRSVPEFAILRLFLAVAHIEAGARPEALAVLRAAPHERIPTISGVSCQFLRFVLEGRREDALRLVTPDLEARAGRVDLWSWCLAVCFAVADESERAIDWMERGLDQGLYFTEFFGQHSRIFRPLYGNPRFQDVVARMSAAHDRLTAELGIEE
jgi:serine/threonine protein kinase